MLENNKIRNPCNNTLCLLRILKTTLTDIDDFNVCLAITFLHKQIWLQSRVSRVYCDVASYKPFTFFTLAKGRRIWSDFRQIFAESTSNLINIQRASCCMLSYYLRFNYVCCSTLSRIPLCHAVISGKTFHANVGIFRLKEAESAIKVVTGRVTV